jgi:hypothetical protein
LKWQGLTEVIEENNQLSTNITCTNFDLCIYHLKKWNQKTLSMTFLADSSVQKLVKPNSQYLLVNNSLFCLVNGPQSSCKNTKHKNMIQLPVHHTISTNMCRSLWYVETYGDKLEFLRLNVKTYPCNVLLNILDLICA